MKNHRGETVLMQRGEAIPGDGGKVIASGKTLKRATGTERNFGLNKAIYKHGMTREQVKEIPYNIKKEPVEVTSRGQDIYQTYMGQDKIKTVASKYGKHKTIASLYKDTR